MKVSSITDQNQRTQNEDNRLIVPRVIEGKKALLACVFDGMGGTDAGEEASKIASEFCEEWYSETKLGSASQIKTELNNLLVKINDSVCLYAKDTGKTLGSTAAILVIYNDEYIVANIGDSRIYKFGSKNMQITKDQTLAQREIDKGNLTIEEAINDRRSHILTESLGSDSANPDFFKGKVRTGDSFLICSDGMYNRVSIDEMSEIVKDSSLSTKSKLIELAVISKSKGEKDNITGIIIDI